MKPRFLYPAVFLLSAVGIAYELTLMRVFSIAQWHHFAYMAISIAMLGLGAAGTVLAMARERLRGKEALLLRIAVFLAAISLVACYEASQRIPFETFRLVTQPDQIWSLFLLYVVLALPFFFISACITLGFMLRPDRAGRVYFVNLLGSGVGAVIAVALMYGWHPGDLPGVLLGLAIMGFLLVMLDPPRLALTAVCSMVVLCLLVALAGGKRSLRISEYKGLSYALQYPDAEVVAEAQSPLSWIAAVSSKQIRETPGQIGNYPMRELGPLPEQVGLFFDGGAVSVVNRCEPGADFSGPSKSGFAYLDYVTAALPYRIIQKPNVLVIGAGGGTDVLMALSHGAEHVTAVEVDPRVFPMVGSHLAEFSGNLYDREDVTAVTAEARGFLQGSDERFDLIQIALLDSFNAASAGVHALSENYLYTREAVALYLEHLSPNGVLAVTRWLKTPPRDAIKMFATLVEACEDAGIEDPARHVLFIRSWNTATLVVSRAPLSAAQVAAARAFCASRQFDLCYLPGMTGEEANQHTILEEAVYFESAREILSPEREAFYDGYLFHVRPATDERPYFFRFFKWSSVGRLWRGMGTEWVPFVEWGYLALVATLAQGALASVVLILLPLILHRRRAPARGARRWVWLYFTCLGLGYMFIEIAFIQKFMLFLAYPVYAVAVVLAAFLVFSGVGSYLADRYRQKVRVWGAVVGIACLSVTYALGLSQMLADAQAWGDPAKVGLAVIALFPLAISMGVPFPMGLQVVSNRHRELLPWAWGVNGLMSVLGAGLAVLIAIHAGFRVLVLAGVVVYIVAAFAFRRLTAGGGR